MQDAHWLECAPSPTTTVTAEEEAGGKKGGHNGASVLPDEGEGEGGGASFLPAGSYLTSSVNMPTEKHRKTGQKTHNKRPPAHPAKIKAAHAHTPT